MHPRARLLAVFLSMAVLTAACASAPQGESGPGAPDRPVAIVLPGDDAPQCQFDSVGVITLDANSALGVMDTTVHRQFQQRAARLGADAVLLGRGTVAPAASGRMVAEEERRGGRQMGASGRTPPAGPRPVSQSRVRGVAIRFTDPACKG